MPASNASVQPRKAIYFDSCTELGGAQVFQQEEGRKTRLAVGSWPAERRDQCMLKRFKDGKKYRRVSSYCFVNAEVVVTDARF